MSHGAQSAFLPDGRLHLHHGPIDLVISAEGADSAAAFRAATERFQSVLAELMEELPLLTAPFTGQTVRGDIARRMRTAVAPLAADQFVTPMAAVAGAVADEICAVMRQHNVRKAIVNNGGDIAFHLSRGTQFRGLSATGEVSIQSDEPARGVATSGWRGRSQSLGIADAVTVVAETAAGADAAATLIANTVDLPGHPAIVRDRAADVEAVPQLGDRLVTVDVGPLTHDETQRALHVGAAYAQDLFQRGLILGAALLLNEETCAIGSLETATRLLADPS